VVARERLREDCELAQQHEVVPTDWEQVLNWMPTAEPGSGTGLKGALPPEERLDCALRELGPGMADVAHHCCLEGLRPSSGGAWR
jgi:hypothetical protein